MIHIKSVRILVISLLIVFSIIIPSVFAAVTNIRFEGNESFGYDNNGIFTVNWTDDNVTLTSQYTLYFVLNNDTSVAGQVITAANMKLTGTNNSGSGTVMGFAVSAGQLSNGTYAVLIMNGTVAGQGVKNVSSQNITIDTIRPQVTLNGPANNTWANQRNVSFNFTFTDNNATAMNFTLYVDGVGNSTGFDANNTQMNLTLAGLTNGSHWFIVQSTDNATNVVNSSNMSVTVDTINPTATVNFPANNTWVKQRNVSINFTLTDNFGQSVNYTLYVDGVGNTTGVAVNNSLTNVTVEGLTNASHWFIVQSTDNATNVVNSSNMSVIVDTINPAVTVNGPVNNSNSSNWVLFNFTETDNFATALNYTIYIDGVGNATGNAPNATVVTVNVSGISDGNHSFIIQSMDNASNAVNSSNQSFRTDVTAPTNVTLQLSKSSISIYDSVSITCFGADSVSNILTLSVQVTKPSGSTLTDTTNGTTMTTTISGSQTGAVGTYTVRCTATDGSGNTGTVTGQLSVSEGSQSSGGGGSSSSNNNNAQNNSNKTTGLNNAENRIQENIQKNPENSGLTNAEQRIQSNEQQQNKSEETNKTISQNENPSLGVRFTNFIGNVFKKFASLFTIFFGK